MAMKVALNSLQAHHLITHHSFASSFPRSSGAEKRPGLACRSPPRVVTSCVLSNHATDHSERFFDSGRSQDWSGYRRFSGLPCPEEDFPCPAMLGISPDPPDWPERSEAAMISIEQRANRLDIPLSIRMLKMKQRQMEMGLGLLDDAVKGENCSVRRAFSSFALIIRELHTYAVKTTEKGLGVESVQREIDASLVWLFRQVFSQTPTLMVYVMTLLANFSLRSIVGDSVIQSPMITLSDNTVEDTDKAESAFYTFKDEQFGLTEEEEALWKQVSAEVAKMKGDDLDKETSWGLIAPVTVHVDREEQEEYLRTSLLYQMNLSQDPNNPLLLCNYARFLAHISHSYDRAEEYFKRATQSEHTDAEAVTQYADFLLLIRKDMWGAEERYQQAIAMEPDNPYYASKYANFLWSNGGEETCFPLEPNEEKNISSADEHS